MADIGVMGCGRMGGPMLMSLRKAGFDALGYDIRPPSEFGEAAPFISNGPISVSTAITVVRDIEQTDDVIFGKGELVRDDSLCNLIVSSTLSPRYIHELRERLPKTITLIDAPMSGAQIAAQNSELSFMLGGGDTTIDGLMPFFKAMGTSFHRMGPLGSGMHAKVLNNLLAAANTVMTRKVLDWADDAGLDEDNMLRLIHASSGQNWLASGFNDIEFARDGYAHDNTIGILEKDVESALDALTDPANQTLLKQIIKEITALTPRAKP